MPEHTHSDSVEGSKSDLNNTVQGVCKDLDAAIAEANGVVSTTSTTATTVLADITCAAEGMKANSYASIDSFTTVLDGKASDSSTHHTWPCGTLLAV